MRPPRQSCGFLGRTWAVRGRLGRRVYRPKDRRQASDNGIVARRFRSGGPGMSYGPACFAGGPANVVRDSGGRENEMRVR